MMLATRQQSSSVREENLEWKQFLRKSKSMQNLYAEFGNSQIAIEDLETMDKCISSLSVICMFQVINTDNLMLIRNRMKGFQRRYSSKRIYIKLGVIHNQTNVNEYKSFYFVKFFAGDEEIIVIDSFNNVYDNWDNFMENHNFSLGWICVPKNGEYNFEGGKLQLQYKNSRKLKIMQTSQVLSVNRNSWLAEIYSFIEKNRKVIMGVLVEISKFINTIRDNPGRVCAALARTYGISLPPRFEIISALPWLVQIVIGIAQVLYQIYKTFGEKYLNLDDIKKNVLKALAY